VLPIIFIGSYEQSCPPEIAHLICQDLTWLYVSPDSPDGSVRGGIKTRLDKLVKELNERIAAISATREPNYDKRRTDLKGFLFGDTKSRWGNPINFASFETAFVKTASFLKARNREVSFVVGRKGAGKSTITHVLPFLLDPRPELVLRLEFDDIPFQTCYNVLREHPAEASDLRKALSPIFTYQLLWDAFLHLCWCWALGNSMSGEPTLSSFLDRVLGETTSKIENHEERNFIAVRALFVYAFEQLVTFMRSVVLSMTPDSTLATIVGGISPSAFRYQVFGREGWKDVATSLNAYRTSRKPVLITADGFDVMTGYFTTSGDDPEGASVFEKELLLALFQIVLNKGPKGSGTGTLYQMADFCVAIPHDRFVHVKKIDRDRYQYRQRFSRIAWSGIELSALVRKRLALLREVEDLRGGSLEDRLAQVMKKGYPELPGELSFQFGTATYRMPLFIYVLRHSFWRPRDVLFFYAALLAASEHFRKKNEVMPTGFVRQVIAGSTRYIVEDEFLDEFGASIRNLRSILKAFQEAPQVLEWAKVQERIEKMRFDTILPEGESASLEWKIELLHDIGVLGVVLDRRDSQRLSAFRHAFSFNEPHSLEHLGRDMYPSVRYALHPLFVEFLHLDTTGNPELILPMDWEYLHNNELLRGIVST
jgi:energy-coupling factor transporter ATP-binding protein EcfA2